MLGLSMTEIVIILGLALLLLGPDQLPSIAKTLGKGMREIRKATDDLKSTFDQEMVRLGEPEPQRMLQPVSSDPGSARAEARSAAAAPADPASARAAARRVVPLERADLSLPHAARDRGAAGGRKGAPLFQQRRAVLHLLEGRPVRRPLPGVAGDPLAGLGVHRSGAVPPRTP